MNTLRDTDEGRARPSVWLVYLAVAIVGLVSTYLFYYVVILPVLLEYRYRPTELAQAALEGDVSRLNGLLAAGAAVNARCWLSDDRFQLHNKNATALHFAALACQLEAVEALLTAGADVNAETDAGQTPLWMAASDKWMSVEAGEGCADVARALLAAGARLHARDDLGQTPLYVAATYDSPRVAKILIEAGDEVDARDNVGRTALYVAAQKHHVGTVKVLLQHGADVNARDDWHGDTPLIHACFATGFSEVWGILIDAGAEVDARNDEGWTALHNAALYSEVEGARFLLARGADVNEKADLHGHTPLTATRGNRSAEMWRLLLYAGADVKAKGYQGMTALHNAAAWGDLEGAKVLLAHGAVVNMRDWNGFTPLDLAENRSKSLKAAEEVAKLLRDHGGVRSD